MIGIYFFYRWSWRASSNIYNALVSLDSTEQDVIISSWYRLNANYIMRIRMTSLIISGVTLNVPKASAASTRRRLYDVLC